MATNVLAVAQTDEEFIYIGCEDGNEYHLIVSISDKIERFSLAGKRLKKAIFGRGEMGKKVCALETEAETGQFWTKKTRSELCRSRKAKSSAFIKDSRFAPNFRIF